MTIIMNTGRVPQQVGVINIKTGQKASVRVMGRGRGVPAAGYTVDPNWMALNGKNIKLVEATPHTTGVVHGKTKSSNLKTRMAAIAGTNGTSGTKPVEPAHLSAAVEPKATTAPTVATKGATT
jgi:hypothetical protein